MKVSKILGQRTGHVATVSPDENLRDAARKMVEQAISALLVQAADGKMVGILTERDIARHFSQSGSGEDPQVSSLMTGNIISCALHDDVTDVTNIMMSQNIRHLPVLDNGKAVGVLSIRDLVRDHVSALEGENRTLRELIAALE
jgi:CBS domain-containing protein